jgi:peptide/nickel transport system substrate-binding protein
LLEPEKASMSKLKAFIPATLSLALIAAPAVMPAHAAGNLVAVLEAEIATLDPHFTPAYISRTFGFMVFDTLFAGRQGGDQAADGAGLEGFA